jgi:adenylate kinase family enzyme
VDRIAIIGCGGSGKSRLARTLGDMLGITPVHLDGLYYDRDWKPLDKEQFAALQRDLVARARWIIDGNYASSLPIRLEAADTVIFLNFPAWACLWGIIQRRLRHGGGQHGAVGVYDRITWSFIRYIAGYRKQMAPRVRHLIADYAGDAQVVVLLSRHAVRRYLAGVAAPGSAAALAVAAGEERGLTPSADPRSNDCGEMRSGASTQSATRAR